MIGLLHPLANFTGRRIGYDLWRESIRDYFAG
jgi:hypothetical protein